MPRLVCLAGRHQIDAEHLGAELGEQDRRADRAEDVGYGVGDRHCVERRLGLVRWQAQAG